MPEDFKPLPERPKSALFYDALGQIKRIIGRAEKEGRKLTYDEFRDIEFLTAFLEYSAPLHERVLAFYRRHKITLAIAFALALIALWFLLGR